MFFVYINLLLTSDQKYTNNRVWKGILGISRDLTKIECGIRENAKYLDGIRDLTATRQAGFTKVLARDAVVFGIEVT